MKLQIRTMSTLVAPFVIGCNGGSSGIRAATESTAVSSALTIDRIPMLTAFQYSPGGNWSTVNDGCHNEYGPGCSWDNATAGNSFQVAFTGRSFDLYLCSGNMMGMADIYLDGSYVTTVENYADSDTDDCGASGGTAPYTQAVARGSHTLKVVNTGNRNPNAWSNYLEVDRLVVASRATSDPCSGVTCGGNGTCTNSGGTASCACNPGFVASGLDCVGSSGGTDPCTGMNCSGHGSCSSSSGAAVCTCDSGYQASGSSCLPTPSGGGSFRNPSDQPFSSTSFWNLPIGSGAQWSNPGDADQSQMNAANGAVNAGAWGQPIYEGQASDPTVTVTNSDSLFPVPAQQIHVPIGATPAQPYPGGDQHMAFFDQTNPTLMWSYWGCNLNNGADVTGGISCGLGTVMDVCGDALSQMSGIQDYNFAIGAIRHWELEAGAIHHALRYAVSTDLAKSPGSSWMDNIPWPDVLEDYSGPQVYTGNLVFGSTIGIPSDVDLSSVGLSQGGWVLATALQQYGAVMRDSGGSNQVTFYAEPQDEGNAVLDDMRGDMGKIVPLLRVMRNQGPNSVNGGGTPLAPLAPPLDPSVCP